MHQESSPPLHERLAQSSASDPTNQGKMGIKHGSNACALESQSRVLPWFCTKDAAQRAESRQIPSAWAARRCLDTGAPGRQGLAEGGAGKLLQPPLLCSPACTPPSAGSWPAGQKNSQAGFNHTHTVSTPRCDTESHTGLGWKGS